MAVEFHDFRIQVQAKMQEAAEQFLEEAASEIQSEAQRNTRVDTGQLKGSWDHVIDSEAHEASVGSPLENAIWEEFGTGEYALEGNGRKDAWNYQDSSGKWHKTTGKRPNRALWNAFKTKQSQIKKRAEEIMKGLN